MLELQHLSHHSSASLRCDFRFLTVGLRGKCVRRIPRMEKQSDLSPFKLQIWLRERHRQEELWMWYVQSLEDVSEDVWNTSKTFDALVGHGRHVVCLNALRCLYIYKHQSNLDMEISGTAATHTKPAASQRFQVGLPLTSLNPPWFHVPHSIGNDQTPRMNMLNTTQRRMKLGSFLIRTRVEIWLVNFVSLRNLFACRFTLTKLSQSHANR